MQQRITQQFLRALRGKRSQVALARRLGYRANPITDWENGRRTPTTREALRAAARCGLDVLGAFARFAPNAPLTRTGRGFEVGAWLSQLIGNASIAEVARKSGHSRSSMSRWLSGTAQPRLPQFFELVDVLTGRLPDLIAELVPIEQVPLLAARHTAAQAAKQLAFNEPWTEAILRLLETRSYAQTPNAPEGWFAERLGISIEDEARCLKALEHSALIQRTPRGYKAGRSLSVDTQASQRAQDQLKRHWSLVAANRATQRRSGDWLAYNVISVSASDLARIQQLLQTTYREVRAIVASSQPEECAALVNLQLVRWS